MIPPGVFIPVAEQCGLMDPIGLLVLRTGCRQLRLWDEAGLPALRLAVNLSAGQFSDRNLVRSIADALSVHSVPAHRLEVEMTESAAMHDRDMTSRVFSDLHALGATVAIDDFGTGYSTMSHLRDLRFDTLKIDREFVRGVESSRSGRAICKALIELANGLDIEVLAEGVETAEEVYELRSHGCGLFQGYHFGRPMPEPEFHAMLRAAPADEVMA
jgi:EAL domain-containing protein (putative c-di-GMP-specific phosphodiesterase class I)